MAESREIGLDAVGDDGCDELGLLDGVPVVRWYRVARPVWDAIKVASFQISQ